MELTAEILLVLHRNVALLMTVICEKGVIFFYLLWFVNVIKIEYTYCVSGFLGMNCLDCCLIY